VLELLEYIPRGDRNLMKNIIANLKYFVGKVVITEKEMNMIKGSCTDREESGEEIEMQENIEEWPFLIYHSFLKV
jgi:hypothetical protein